LNRPPPDAGKDPDEVNTLSFLSQRGKREKNLINIKLHRAALEISGDEGSRGRTLTKYPLAKCSKTVHAFSSYQENSDLHFFQFDYTVRTEPET